MRRLAIVLYILLTSAAALKHRSGENPIDWRLVPPSVYENLHNHETLVTIPEGPPKGVIFVLAACDTFLEVWGFPSHGCKHCVGKPEEMLIVYHAITRGYVVVVIGPLLSGVDNLCFMRTWPPEESLETAELRRTMRLILEEHDWWHLPRFLLGTSAGGSAAMILAARFPVQAVASMLMGLQPDHMFEERNLLCWNPDTALKRNMTWAYPPVLLLKASNDNDGVKERMDNTKNFFRRHGIYAELIVMEPYPFQPHTFGRMLPYVDSDQSVALFEEFRAVGLIDERGFGQMPQYHESVERWEKSRDDLRHILISHFAKDSADPNRAVHKFVEHMWKMFYAAQAVHETRGKEINQVLDFFERRAVPDMEEITDKDSDLVHQWGSNAEDVAYRLGLPKDGSCGELLPRPAEARSGKGAR
ncbi:g4550 [Coccomyxa viridis]|uniref:G4550 protein n=1 Tax=Coccomyxa viridis TaxID=1274662 RepID=A0ABP1FQJ7_9CHLO